MTTTTTLRAYLGDPKLKTAMLREMKQHQRLDQIVKGHYGEMNGKFTGCAIGCALHSLNLLQHPQADRTVQLERVSNHERFPAELGIPLELAYVIDNFFEELPQAESDTWPVRVLAAVPVGADLSQVLPQLLQWSILDKKYGWMAYAKTADQQALVQRFAATVAKDWSGTVVSDQEWIALTRDLDRNLPEWAGAWVWAGAWARVWAGAWARARARAWARAGADWYKAASVELIRLLEATK